MDLGVHVHGLAAGTSVGVRAQPCQAWGSVLEPKSVHLCGLSVADYKHPNCMPTCAHMTPLSVRVPRVIGCIRQGLHGAPAAENI